MTLFDALIAKTLSTPSMTAYLCLGTIGDNVSVTRKVWTDTTFNDTFTWYHKLTPITETEARRLLDTIKIEEILQEPEVYNFKSGWSAKRETGVIYLPKNDGIGIDAHGFWVLRNEKSEAVDRDQYRHDMFGRYPECEGYLDLN